MPAFLKRKDDILTVSLGQMAKPEFQDALARVKSVPGRRFNPDDKTWEFPYDANTAMRLMQMLEPVADAEVQQMVRNHAAQVAEDLITRLPTDADLSLPYADYLFPFQRAGVGFMVEKRRVILADEMGAGKTLEALATVHEARLRAEAEAAAREDDQLIEGTLELRRPVLVVCPNPVMGTWVSHIERGPTDEKGKPIIPASEWPGGEVCVIDGRNPAKRRQQAESDADYFVVNYEKLAARVKLAPVLAKREWGAVVADEAHRMKNRKAQQTKAMLKLTAPVQLAATGTPIMNSPDELWALLRWLRPEQYTSFWAFHYAYVDEYNTRYGAVMTGVRNVDQLRFELSDKLVRRTKRDVLPDLPEKLPPQIIEVKLSPAERKLYDEAEKALIFDMVQFAEAHPDIDVDDLATMPIKTLEGLIPNAGARIAKLRQITAAAKVPVARELIRDAGTPVVAFTWHRQPAFDLAESLESGKPPLRVARMVGDDDANAEKDAFQEGRRDHVVATIRKGGVGITLTRSSTALMVEEDWVPDINAQAIDRLHRPGQKNAVSTIILRCPDTVDTRNVVPANRLKQMISEQVLGSVHGHG